MRKLFGRVCAVATAAVMMAGTVMAQLPVGVYASDDKGLVAAATQQPFRVLTAQDGSRMESWKYHGRTYRVYS